LRDGDNCIEKIPLSHEAVDFGSSVPGRLPYQPWAAALVKQRVADLCKDDPHARCMPPTFPRAFAFSAICLENDKSVRQMTGK